MAEVLVAFATKMGSTEEIAEELRGAPLPAGLGCACGPQRSGQLDLCTGG
ncbi:hypothetical protein [Pseudonocardia acaciae]|nr:hypothetical protein [Pseudonocardia acaciae]